jgi:hypothetical protein
VPLYHTELGPFTNTQAFLADVLDRQRRAPISTQLEVETYTWDVLPPEQRTETVVASIARELDWVTERLARQTTAPRGAAQPRARAEEPPNEPTEPFRR